MADYIVELPKLRLLGAPVLKVRGSHEADLRLYPIFSHLCLLIVVTLVIFPSCDTNISMFHCDASGPGALPV